MARRSFVAGEADERTIAGLFAWVQASNHATLGQSAGSGIVVRIRLVDLPQVKCLSAKSFERFLTSLNACPPSYRGRRAYLGHKKTVSRPPP